MEPSDDDKSFFEKGSLVEVSSDSEGFDGVWYEAKVLEPPPPPPPLTPSPPNMTKKDRFFHIEYQSLLCDDGSENPLIEYVKSSLVRPLPPKDEHDLQVNDFVDAMHLDGWWVGVVLKVNQDSNIYSVYFENPPELLHFKRRDLRAHWDWEGGKWVRPQKQAAKVSSRVMRHWKDFFVGMQYEEQSPCSGTANPEETDIVANCKKLKSIAQKKGRGGCLKRKRGERQKTSAKGKKCDGSSDTVDVIVLKDYDSTHAESSISIGESKRTKHDGAGDGVDKLVLKYDEIYDELSTENMEESKVRKHDGAGNSVDKFAFKDHAIDAESAKNTGNSEGTKNDGAGGDVDNMVLKHPVIIDAESPTNTAQSKVKKCDGSSDTVDVRILKDYDSTHAESPISIGESKHRKHDGAGDDVDKLVLKYHEIDEGLSTENMEESKVRKHDGAGSSVDKFAFKDHAIDAELAKITGDSEGTKNDGAGGGVDNMVLKYPGIIDAESPTNTAQSKDKECDGAGVAVNKMNLQDCASNGVESSKITRESTGSEDASAEKAAKISHTGCSMREAEMAIVQSPGNMDIAEQPISMWFDGLSSQKIVIDSRFLCGRTVNQNQRNKAEGKVIEIVKESTANDSVSDRIRDENQCFPGIEPSSMWKTFIESVEVFKKIPQKPHFHPLKQCKEMYRDGIEFGYMITFAKVVKRTSELQVNDPKSMFDRISETLQDLELHGFDVQPIRNRLTELELMKDRQEQLQEASKEFEHQILERTHEQMKINAEFAEVVEAVKLLEEKKRKVMLLMQENDSKITELKSNLDVCNQDIQNAQLDFESLAAAPW